MAVTQVRSQDHLSNAAARLRVELACALRWAVRYEMHEGICNHFSVMLPGRRDRFLLNPKGRHFARMRARDLVMIDDQGNTVEGEGAPSRTGFCIHTRIHLHHPHAQVVLHTHMPWATTLTAIRGGRLLPLHQNATRYFDDCAYDEVFSGLAFDVAEGERMAAAFEGRKVLFLGNHGVIVVGETIAEAFDDLYYLERACQIQVLAMSTGQPLAVMPDDVARETAAQFSNRKLNADLHFAELQAILDDEGSDYAH